MKISPALIVFPLIVAAHRLPPERRSKDKKYDMCLITPVAIDTSLHLLEWIAWHNLLGVDCFHLWIDEDKHKSDTARLILDILEHLPSLVKLGSCAGLSCYRGRTDSLNQIQTSNSASYVAAVDTDEFIRFEDGSLQNIPMFVDGKLRANEKSDLLYLIRYHFESTLTHSDSPLRVTNIPTSPQTAYCSGLKWGKYIGTGTPTWKWSTMHTWKEGNAIFSNGTVMSKTYQQQVPPICPTQPLAINHYERSDVCMKKLENKTFAYKHRSIDKCMGIKYLNRDASSKDRIYRHFDAITRRISEISERGKLPAVKPRLVGGTRMLAYDR
jgi:hypothetical protein